MHRSEFISTKIRVTQFRLDSGRVVVIVVMYVHRVTMSKCTYHRINIIKTRNPINLVYSMVRCNLLPPLSQWNRSTYNNCQHCPQQEFHEYVMSLVYLNIYWEGSRKIMRWNLECFNCNRKYVFFFVEHFLWCDYTIIICL